MIFEHQNYRTYLRAVLVSRISINPAYSLRCLAMELGISPALLSLVISGRKNFSTDRALGVAQKLELNRSESEYFCALVQFETAKTETLKNQCLEKMRRLNRNKPITDLNTDFFHVIAEWYHIPILLMTDLDDFELSPKSAAKHLGISVLEASAALDRLQRLELLERDTAGRWRRVPENGLFKSETANRGLQHFHRQMLMMAMRSLETQDNREKVVGSQTFSVDVEQLPAARKMIEEFLNAVAGHFDKGNKRTEVYHLGVQLFNVKGGGKVR
jgi:uncharacterized protein (TIGR02147 family)